MATIDEILSDGERGDTQPRDERGRFSPTAPPAEPDVQATPETASPELVAPAAPPEPAPSAQPTPPPARTPEEPRDVVAFKAAAIEERRKRQELERRLAEMEKRQAAPVLPDDPYAAEIEQKYLAPRMQELEQRMLDRMYNAIEASARVRYPDYDEVRAQFLELCEQDPSAAAGLRDAPDPAEYAYKTAKKYALMREIGDDPVAYRARVEAEIRKDLEAKLGQPRAMSSPTPPSSLNGEKSPAATAQVWSGPTPISSLFNPR